MFRLGLTGSIATGKSTVLGFFADAGIPVYSADDAVHELYRGAAVAPVEELFPGVAKNGVIDRSALAAQLVAAPERVAELEAIVHPMVAEKMHQFIANALANKEEMVVLEVPLLFETGRDYPVDAIAVTACDPAEQERRALARPGMNVEKFNTILARQMPQAEKKSRADFIIMTDTTLDDTRKQVNDIISRCRADAKTHREF